MSQLSEKRFPAHSDCCWVRVQLWKHNIHLSACRLNTGLQQCWFDTGSLSSNIPATRAATESVKLSVINSAGIKFERRPKPPCPHCLLFVLCLSSFGMWWHIYGGKCVYPLKMTKKNKNYESYYVKLVYSLSHSGSSFPPLHNTMQSQDESYVPLSLKWIWSIRICRSGQDQTKLEQKPSKLGVVWAGATLVADGTKAKIL